MFLVGAAIAVLALICLVEGVTRGQFFMSPGAWGKVPVRRKIAMSIYGALILVGLAFVYTGLK